MLVFRKICVRTKWMIDPLPFQHLYQHILVSKLNHQEAVHTIFNLSFVIKKSSFFVFSRFVILTVSEYNNLEYQM